MNKKFLIPVFLIVAAMGAGISGFRKLIPHRSIAAETTANSGSEETVKKLHEIRRSYDGAEMRRWLKETGTLNSVAALRSLDNNTDPHSKLRLFALDAIASFRTEGVTTEEKASWGQALEILSMAILSESAARNDYLGQAFLMQSKLEEARRQYLSLFEYPKNSAEHAKAEWFFKTFDAEHTPIVRAVGSAESK